MCKFDALGWVWLPVVIGSRSVKLRCVVVDNLKEKLIIGLPGLSFLGASVNFATGDVRISCRRRKKVEDGITMAKKKEKLHEDHALVRDARTKCEEFKDTAEFNAVPKKKGPESDESEESVEVCIKSQLLEQAKDLASRKQAVDESRDEDKVKYQTKRRKRRMMSLFLDAEGRKIR